MKKIIYLLLMLCIVTSCNNDDDGSTTTGNTDEYFKYSIDGLERIFDYEVEAHLETDLTTLIDKYEINASGQQPSGDLRRIAAVFTFDSSGLFLPNSTYNWGVAQDNNPAAKFYFAENTSTNFFILSADYSVHPIDAEVTSANPINIGDYITFTFNGTFQDENNVTHNIDGMCRVKREVDQDY